MGGWLIRDLEDKRARLDEAIAALDIGLAKGNVSLRYHTRRHAELRRDLAEVQDEIDHRATRERMGVA